MGIIRFIFYIFVFYVVIKILRMFVDPFFETKKNNNTNNVNVQNNKQSKPQDNTPKVGEYVEFEEIK